MGLSAVKVSALGPLGYSFYDNFVCFFNLQFHNSGQAFATASEDKTARLFDIRSDQQLGHYTPPGAGGFTSCGQFSQALIRVISDQYKRTKLTLRKCTSKRQVRLLMIAIAA